MAPPARTLSALEWVGVAVGLWKTLFWTTTSAVTGLFHSNRPASYHRHLLFAFTRAITSSFSAKALVTLTPSTGDMYTKFCGSVGLTPDTVTLEDGTRGHWIGSQSADKVLVFFHGGGYAMSAVDGHFELLWRVVQNAKRNGGDLSVLLLSYDVAVDAPYPRQLQQASALLDNLLHTMNRPASEVILGGDSAGGNLTLAVLSHSMHPHPQVKPLNITGQFAGAALLSPWVTFNTTSTKSMRTNQNMDILAISVLDNWSALFQGGAPTDYYLEPLKAPSDWWAGLPVQDILVTAGADEVFVDDIERFAAQLQTAQVKTTLNTAQGEAHDHLIMEYGLKEPESQARTAFQQWICAHLRG